MNIARFIRECHGLAHKEQHDVAFLPMFLKSLYWQAMGRNIYSYSNCRVNGIDNINVNGALYLGLNHVGFLDKNDRILLNIKGTLNTLGTVSIGKGCRFDVCTDAAVNLDSCSLTGCTNILIAHGLEVGAGSMISWGCEILDEDWHTISYEGKRQKDGCIEIGDHVLIGSHTKILKGAKIARNSVVAANSVVTSEFQEENVLIAGNPAKVIKRDVSWR